MLNLTIKQIVAQLSKMMKIPDSERGLETVEYALLILAIIVIVAAAAIALGDRIVSAFDAALQ